MKTRAAGTNTPKVSVDRRSWVLSSDGRWQRTERLTGIADRVDALGGQLTIHSAVGDGTALVARLPLSTW